MHAGDRANEWLPPCAFPSLPFPMSVETTPILSNISKFSEGVEGRWKEGGEERGEHDTDATREPTRPCRPWHCAEIDQPRSEKEGRRTRKPSRRRPRFRRRSGDDLDSSFHFPEPLSSTLALFSRLLNFPTDVSPSRRARSKKKTCKAGRGGARLSPAHEEVVLALISSPSPAMPPWSGHSSVIESSPGLIICVRGLRGLGLPRTRSIPARISAPISYLASRIPLPFEMAAPISRSLPWNPDESTIVLTLRRILGTCQSIFFEKKVKNNVLLA